MLARSLVTKMKPAERKLVRDGSLTLALFTGAVAYWNYREKIRKEFLRSEGHYRFSHVVENVTPWKQLYWTWWRMPKEEYNVYHRFRPYYIIGQIDYSKEILLPVKRDGVDGFDVINPLYCYEGGKTSFEGLANKKDPVKIERAAVIVNRGWIPANLRDRKYRPLEINSRQLVKLRGVFRAGKDVHDYKYPNNPDNNEWYNLSLEDIGLFWDLPNFDEQKYYYFHAVDITPNANDFQKGSGVTPMTKDQLIEDHYGWRWNESTHNLFEKTFGLASAGALAIAYFAI